MERIGKYAIVGQIGTGGFGVVYEGRDPFLKRRVAIKTCTSDEPDIRDRFFREAEIAGNLQHRNVVTVHDFGVQDEVPYLVQEYLDGEDLDRVVSRREPLPALRRVEILAQVARGLEYAHARGVIHRDVKPGNIRLCSDGTVKIMDFGIAKLSNVASHLTRTGMTLGTAAYLPPEQIRGTPVDHRADLFSFGVTAYELLTYRRPFSGKTISALFWELLQRDPEPVSAGWPGCPPALEALVLRCLAKDPGDRYPGFTALLGELDPMLEGMRRAWREEEPTAPHRTPSPRPAPRAAPPPPASPPRVEPAPAAPPRPSLVQEPRLPTPPPRGRSVAPPPAASAGQQPRETAGLLGDVQEALSGARVAAGARRVRELLAEGELEAAERELEGMAAAGGAGELAALRRDVARARDDRALARAVARWEQGEPQPALALIEELLAASPGHGDARRLRDAWRDELAQREAQRAASAGETEARRRAVSAAVGRIEGRLSSGDLEGADAALAAALAELGSHQPLRDLRRQIGEARGLRGSQTISGVRRISDATTRGVPPGSVAAARERAAPGATPPPASGAVGGASAAPPRLDEAPGPGSWRVPRFGLEEAESREPARRLALIAAGALLALLILIALLLWLRARGSEPVVPAPPAQATASPATPAERPPSPGASPAGGSAVGGAADPP